MKTLIVIMAFLLLACTELSAGAIDRSADRDARKPAQAGFSTVVVNGRTLTGPNSSAQTRDGRLFLPVGALARALGDSVSIDAAERRIAVLQQTGVRTTFDQQAGHVLENGAVVLSVTNAGRIVISPYLDELLLPVEIATALFDIETRFDKDNSTVYVTRGVLGMVTQQKEKRGIGEIYLADYEYDLNRYLGTNSHDLSLNAIGRLGDGRFSLVSNSSFTSQISFSPRNFTFNLERPNGQNYVAGDLGAASGLQLIASNIRGGLVSLPVGNFTIAAFGGKANSGSFGRGGFIDVTQTARSNQDRDTNIFGATATVRPITSGSFRPLIVTAGAMRFASDGRTGNVAATNVNFGGPKIQFQGEVAVGNFSGSRPDGNIADGVGTAFEFSGSYQLSERLAFQGRVAHVGSNFLAPQVGVREPHDLKAGGISWSPTRWLTTSMNGSWTKRPGIDSAESYLSTSIAVSPGDNKPSFYISHTQSGSAMFRKGEFTLVNFSKNFQRVRLFANASRIKNIGPAATNVQIGSNLVISDKNTLEVSQGFASRNASNGLVEWRANRVFSDRLNFSAGMGYNYSPTSGYIPFEKLSANLSLPRETSLQLNYLNTNAGPTVLVKLRGLLFRKREATAYLNSLPSEVNNYSRISGRVYQDNDGDGKYDPQIDKPQASVKVRVDGNRYVETDVNGLFAFDALPSGEHKVAIDLMSVRADLTMLDGGSRDVILDPGKLTQFDFRLVRTGRITGRVWLDTNENGTFDDGEMPLADVRVVTGSGRDTLTDADGSFALADLPPGEHVFLLDEKTLPEKTVSGKKPLAVQAFPGRETSDVFLTVINIPAEVKKFPAKQQQ
ncbi:MAG: hypothetical protein QM785_07770 [Pyrinomonadaceae bacterium]